MGFEERLVRVEGHFEERLANVEARVSSTEALLEEFNKTLIRLLESNEAAHAEMARNLSSSMRAHDQQPLLCMREVNAALDSCATRHKYIMGIALGLPATIAAIAGIVIMAFRNLP